MAWRNFFPPVAEKPFQPPPIVFEPRVPIVTTDNPIRGSKAPRHTLIEFGDFECSACRFNASFENELLARHSDLRFVWKDAPSADHFFARTAAGAGQCAAEQGKFWEFRERIYALDSAAEPAITAVANNLGLDLKRFNACRESPQIARRLESAVLQAVALGVTATPFYFLDGAPLGALGSLTEFEAALKNAPPPTK